MVLAHFQRFPSINEKPFDQLTNYRLFLLCLFLDALRTLVLQKSEFEYLYDSRQILTLNNAHGLNSVVDKHRAVLLIFRIPTNQANSPQPTIDWFCTRVHSNKLYLCEY